MNTFGLEINDEDVMSGQLALASMLDGTTDIYRSEKRLIHADGHEIWVALSTVVRHGHAVV